MNKHRMGVKNIICQTIADVVHLDRMRAVTALSALDVRFSNQTIHCIFITLCVLYCIDAGDIWRRLI